MRGGLGLLYTEGSYGYRPSKSTALYILLMRETHKFQVATDHRISTPWSASLRRIWVCGLRARALSVWVRLRGVCVSWLGVSERGVT